MRIAGEVSEVVLQWASLEYFEQKKFRKRRFAKLGSIPWRQL